ncbi:PREDICTED: stress-activated map kinase-interacting protein 1 [Drosophila arizonae]|uniref:Stress-activated map kinase-interacting protein 1 n=1 Tax=Drosophila arizonae TaxID=7263 RepID=A0ABM1PL87_DROAR|nr:PREDICTED: stress-activated map kinase-interacting protein 1 [Drosophila arizonae]
MATYSNAHWLLSHIRNSFISTDDTGICETVMLSDDMPKHYLRKFQTANPAMEAYRRSHRAAQQRKSQVPKTPDTATPMQRTAPLQHMVPPRIADPPLQEVDFVCYPGLDLSDDEDLDMSTHSFDIQMYPEVGAHRFRSNTAQKLEKLDIAKRKAARIKSVNYNEEVVPPDRKDFFKRKVLNEQPIDKPSTSAAAAAAAAAAAVRATKVSRTETASDDEVSEGRVRSKLSEQLARSPKQAQNRFIEYARFDGTAQVGMPTKRINVYVNMLPEPERNYPLKICVLSTAKIIEVIGLVCYKTTLQYPDAVQLQSVQHYALYMTEDNDDMDDFPPLDNREPCSKFGFSHLTLAERRPLAPVTRIDYHNQLGTKSMTSEEDKAAMADAALHALQNINLNGDVPDAGGGDSPPDHVKEYEQRLLNHNDMLEAPMHRTYRVSIIGRPFFKYDATLAVSGERIEIDQLNNHFFMHRKPLSTPIDLVAHCEIVDQGQQRAMLRIWLKANSSISLPISCTSAPSMTSITSGNGVYSPANSRSPWMHSSSRFGVTTISNIRFKHYDFVTDVHTAEQIRNKLNCILEMRASDVRREFLLHRERKQKQLAKRQLKL